MDELFFIPPATVALPHAHWIDKPWLSSHLMVIQPSASEFSRVQGAMKTAKYGVYDMDIVNKLYGSDCSVFPHRKYALMTGEFRSKDHSRYLAGATWDPREAIAEAKFVHFSDDPLPKPWQITQKEMNKMTPKCSINSTGGEDCWSRDVWLEIYRDFKERRRVRLP